MATCPKCKLEIPDGARKCGHCGADLRPMTDRIGMLVLGVAGLVLAAIVFLYLFAGAR